MEINWDDNDLYDKKAKAIAVGFIDKNSKNNSVSRHQFRRFFDEFKRLDKKLEEGADFEKQILPLLKLQKAKIAYACQRMIEKNSGSKSIYNYFKEFFYSAIDKIENENHFKKFINLNEAVYAYYYAEGGSKTK